MTLTTDEASHARFISTRFGKGYSTEEVDAFIQEIIAALRAWETGAAAGAPQPDDDGGAPGHDAQSAGALTSEDVLNKKLQVTRFREGYEQDEVDELLDEVVQTLRAWETGAAPQPDDDGGAPGHGARPAGAPAGVLTSEDVLNKKLQVTRFREGYEQDEVDELLDAIMRVLRGYEARSGH